MICNDPTNTVPEPASMILLGSGLAGALQQFVNAARPSPRKGQKSQ